MTHCSLQSRALIEAYLSLRRAVLPTDAKKESWREAEHQTEAEAPLKKTGLDATITLFTALITNMRF